MECLMKIRMFERIEFLVCGTSSKHCIISFIREKLKMEAATLVVLCELLDSDDEKPTRGKTRNWIKRREERGYFSNIVQELKIEDRLGFKDMFRMDVTDFEYVLSVSMFT